MLPQICKLLFTTKAYVFHKHANTHFQFHISDFYWDTKRYTLWLCQNVCEALIYLLDNTYIRFGTKLYRQIVGIPMGTYCAPLAAYLFYFAMKEGMVNRIYPPELQLNKANTSDTEAPFLDLHLSISNGFVSSKSYDKCDDFDFD